MAKMQGTPCWYELDTRRGGLGAAEAFYGSVLGWSIRDSGMEGFDYHLASVDGAMVAGLMELPTEAGAMGPSWTIYFAVDDADSAAAADSAMLAETIVTEPADIPGTGRFAVATDPQGARFGILQPEPMPGQEGAGGAFDQREGGPRQLERIDDQRRRTAGFAFYAGLFGWKKSQAVDMGEMGTYQLFAHDGADIGGMMGLGAAPAPMWLPYFGTNGVAAAIARIKEAGGKVMHGPIEVPGGAFIAVAEDPQGAHFAVVGPKEKTT